MQLSFGSGAVWGERTDVIGSGIGPRQFGVLQDIQIDFDWSDKELYGQLQFPVAIARGQGKITGKAKFAQILGLLYSDIFFGVTPQRDSSPYRSWRPRRFRRRHPTPSFPPTRRVTMTISVSAMPQAVNGSTG